MNSRALPSTSNDQAIISSFLPGQDDKMSVGPQVEQPIHTFMREL